MKCKRFQFGPQKAAPAPAPGSMKINEAEEARELRSSPRRRRTTGGGSSSSSSWSCLPELTKFQWMQIGLLALCYALAFSSVTLVMSLAPLAVVPAGGTSPDDESFHKEGPIAIALFEIGKSFVVLPVGPAVTRYGRKNVFFAGGEFGLISSAAGILGAWYSLPQPIVVSAFFAGLATGISYGYRFFAIEVSPEHREFACTACLSGGVIAAVIGPVSASYGMRLLKWDDGSENQETRAFVGS